MDLKTKALAVIAKIGATPVEQITPEMELVADLGMDSARALELLVELEEQLGIEISDDDAGQLNTVGDVLTYLEHLDG